MLASKHYTLVVGVDFHATTTPPFNPVHPYIGLVFDIGNLIPFIGCKTFINGVPHGVADTSGVLSTLFHLPILTGPFVKTGFMGNESVNFLGGLKTYSEGRRLSVAPMSLMTCSDVGMPLSLRPGLKSYKPVPTLFLPTSFSIPLPFGAPVNVGGPYVPDLAAVLLNLAMSYGFGCLIKKSGQLVNKLIKKGKSQWSSKLSAFLCKHGFDPVNLVTGAVEYEGVDFELSGPLPLVWKRSWMSDSQWSGILGHGCHSCFDMRVESFPEEELLAVTLPDGRPAFFPTLTTGESHFNREEKLSLFHKRTHYELFDHTTRLSYSFRITSDVNEYLLASVHNEAGHTIELQYSNRYLRRITDSSGRILLVETDNAKRVTKVELYIDDRTRETLVSYTYNKEGDMTGITDSLGQTTRMVYRNHLMIKKTDRNGQSFYWDYDGNTSKARCIQTWGDGGLLRGEITYHKGYNLVTDSLGNTTRYDFRSDGRVTCVTDPLGASTFTDYTEEGDIYRQIDSDGNITGYEYNSSGQLLGVRHPDGGTDRYTYDSDGRIQSETTPEGSTTIYLYDEEGLLTRVVSADAQVTRYVYNANKLISEIFAPGNRHIQLYYDKQHNLTQALLPDGLKTEWSYDFRGQVTGSRNTAGLDNHYRYDSLGRMIQTTSPDGNTVQLSYNAYDEVILATDRDRRVEFEYTPLGSLKKRKENGHVLSFSYNTEELLTSLQNEAGERYSFGRDRAGRIIQETGFDGLTRSYVRSSNGQVRRVDRPGNRFSEYVYDNRGRLCGVEYHDGTYEQYAYNKDSLLVEARTPNSHLKIKRDKQGRITEEWQDGHTVKSVYNEMGQRCGVTSSLGAHIEASYTTAGLLQGMSAGEWDMEVRYDNRGLEVERLLSGGVVSRTEYDSAGRIRFHGVTGNNVRTRHVRYQWAHNDRLIRLTNELTKQDTWFDYDTLGNLVGSTCNETEKLFRVPDAVGNLYKTLDRGDREYGAGGRLLESEGSKYHYDGEGNLGAKVDSKGRMWMYKWNANGSLKEVIRPDHRTVSFEYDALGRRTAKIYDGKVTRWVWDGNTPLHEWSYALEDRPKMVEDEFGICSKDREEPTGNVTTWVFEEGTFRPAAKLTENGSYSIITDYLGTPAQAYDEKGKLKWEAELDIYGKVRTFEGDKAFIPFRYQGQYEDAETGLYYNRFRYYSPEEGMYLSQDPIGLDGGDKLYAYVHDPNSWIDELGLTKYVVYQAPVLDANGKPTGEIYTGRTRGADNMSTRAILNKRKSNHHKNLGQMEPVFETKSYGAVRGGEHYYIKQAREAGVAADQINGISDRNFGKNGKIKKGDKYMEAFYNENPDLKNPKGCH